MTPQAVQSFGQSSAGATSQAPDLSGVTMPRTLSAPTQSSYISSVMSNLGNTFNQGGQNATEDITNIPKVAADAGGSPLADVAATGAALGHEAGNIAGTAGNILGSFITPLLPDTAKQSLGDISTKVDSAVSSIPGMTPEIQKSLGDVFNTVLLQAGEDAGVNKNLTDTGMDLTKGSTLGNAPAEVAEEVTKDTTGGKTTSDANGKVLTPEEIQATKDTMPLPSKDVKINALRNTLPDDISAGGVTREGKLGTTEIQPSAHDIDIGKEASPYTSSTKDPLTKIANVNGGIRDISNTVDDFLDADPTNANLEDMRTYLEDNTNPSKNLAKDTSATEAYSRAVDNGIDTLHDTLKENAEKTGNFSGETSGKTIRDARIAVDNEISRELGESTFDSPQYKGIKAAEVDFRNTMNRMNEDMLRYPDQLGNLNRMNATLKEMQSRGIEVNMKDPDVKAQLEQAHNLTTSPEAEEQAQSLAESHQKMSRLYEARDNMIDNFQKEVGGNKITEYLNKHPLLKKAANQGLRRLIRSPLAIGGTLLGGYALTREIEKLESGSTPKTKGFK